ncbi:MAG: hypothetical protein IPK07_34565 [Deltaproteobacteria bacterium]|nr:hypothetical protein [Deltaproteobacteria bacterium]
MVRRTERHVAALTLAACVASLSCHSTSPSGAAVGSSVPAPPPVLRAAPTPDFTAAELRMVETVGAFYESLLTALKDPALATSGVDACAARIAASLEPVRGAARELAAPHAALPVERRLAIHQEAFRRHPAEVRALVEAAGRWTSRFRSPGDQPQFRRITEQALGTWARRRAVGGRWLRPPTRWKKLRVGHRTRRKTRLGHHATSHPALLALPILLVALAPALMGQRTCTASPAPSTSRAQRPRASSERRWSRSRSPSATPTRPP